jgi:hypothetical protein
MNHTLLAIGIACIGQAGTIVSAGISLAAKRKADEIKDRKMSYRDLVNQIRQGRPELLLLRHGSPHIRDLVGIYRKSGLRQDVELLLEEIDKELSADERIYEKRRKTARRFRRLSVVLLCTAGLLFLATAVGAEEFPNTPFGKFSRHLYALPADPVPSPGRSIRSVPSPQRSWLPTQNEPSTGQSASPKSENSKDTHARPPAERGMRRGPQKGVVPSSAAARSTPSDRKETAAPSKGVSGTIGSCLVKPVQGIVGSAASNIVPNTVRNVSGCVTTVVSGAANSVRAAEGAILPTDPTPTTNAVS